MKQVIIAGIIIILLLLFNSYFQYTGYRDRKSLIINTHVEMEMYIVKGIARSASRWFANNIVKLGRSKSVVEDEVFKYFVDPVLLFDNGDAWIYNRDYVIYDKSSDFPDIYRGKSMMQIFEIQKKSGAYHYDELVHGVHNATEGTGWYVWLPDKGKEWVAWTSIKIGDDTWTIGLSTPEREILKYNGMTDYLTKIKINSAIISVLLLIIFIIIYRMKKNDIENQVELHKAKETAEEASRAKTRFLANISHEIRTPINGIIGMTFMLSQTKPDKQQQEYLRLIESSTDYLMETIDQLLDISRIEAGKFIIQNEDFNLAEVLDISNRIFSVNAKNKKLGFVYNADISSDLMYVRGDRKILRLIINNLLGNAIKYTEKGIVRLSAKAENINGDSVKLIITVSDTGIGIPKEYREKIFDYFYQVDTSTSSKYGKGTGLGLTIVRDIIRLSGGSITVDSEPGQGSSFTVTLNYGKSSGHVADIYQNELWESSTFETDNMKSISIRILLAEDDSINALYMKEILKKVPCSIVYVKNGEEAYNKWLESRFDILIIDGQMPVMSGYETIKKIRAEEADRNLRKSLIIVISAYAMEEEKLNFIDAGADEYISKPIMPDQIISIIKKYSPVTMIPV